MQMKTAKSISIKLQPHLMFHSQFMPWSSSFVKNRLADQSIYLKGTALFNRVEDLGKESVDVDSSSSSTSTSTSTSNS